MPLRTVILLVALYGLLGLCTVREMTRQTEIRYGLAELIALEQRLQERHARLERAYATLTAPARLARLDRELGLETVPLRPLPARAGENVCIRTPGR